MDCTADANDLARAMGLIMHFCYLYVSTTISMICSNKASAACWQQFGFWSSTLKAGTLIYSTAIAAQGFEF